MNFLQKIKNRYTILLMILSLIFIIITFRLTYLMITKGQHYRELADNTRIRKVLSPAPRGEIYDRNGILLAGNKTTFTVQLYKNDINKDNYNEFSLKLMGIFEDGGEKYIDEFPIKLNVIEYKNYNDYKDYINPYDEIAEILIKNNLFSELLIDNYIYKQAILEIENELGELPNNIDINTITKFYKKETKNLKTLLTNPNISKLTYDLLKNKGFDEKFIFKNYVYSFDEELRTIKINLNKITEKITPKTNAKDDFINIILNASNKNGKKLLINELINEKVEVDKKNKVTVGEILFDKLNNIKDEKKLKLPIKLEDNEFKYIDDNHKMKFHIEEGLDKELKPEEVIIYLGKKYVVTDKDGNEISLIGQVITDDKIKGIAQRVMLNNSYNPKISISKFEYVPNIKKDNWIKKIIKKSEDENVRSAENIFKTLRVEYEINGSISDYEARGICVIRELLKKQTRPYEPIDIANDVKDKTIAKIEENSNELIGTEIIPVPTRYYPLGESAAHILGSLGKISQEYEIEKYKNHPKYTMNDIIGKTGIEEEFEEHLKGTYGSKKVDVDVKGWTKAEIEEKKPIPGNSIYLTIDANLQKVAEDSLKRTIDAIRTNSVFKSKWGDFRYNSRKPYKNAATGAVVALDVKTGEVLALANYPAYDPNLFATGISTEDWESFMPENEDNPLAPRPLLNIAMQTSVQPGSVFKMVTGLSGLEKGISPNFAINSRGYIELSSGERFGDWQWNDNRQIVGNTNLYQALKESVNYYFYTLTLGKNLRTGSYVKNKNGENTKLEIEDILRVSTEFGLNDKTGIEISIPSERSNTVPSPEIKVKNVKIGMRRFLNSNISEYIDEDIEYTQKELDDVIDKIVSWADEENVPSSKEVQKRLTDLDLKSGIRLPGQEQNLTEIIKYNYLNQATWKASDSIMVSIGQGDNAYTPLQIANYIATLANKGYKNKVSIIDRLETYDGKILNKNNKSVPELINIENFTGKKETREEKEKRIAEYLDHLKEGMRQVASIGTAKRTFGNFPIKVGVKSGTAEKSGTIPNTNGETYDNFAWFSAFAPYDDPQIAIATVIFQGGYGSYASPISREIIAEYLGLNNVDDNFEYNNKLVK